jgi:hypothetical protein
MWIWEETIRCSPKQLVWLSLKVGAADEKSVYIRAPLSLSLPFLLPLSQAGQT